MTKHVSVLLAETIELLSPKANESLLDCTLGLGGHSAAILGLTGPSGRLVGIDADTQNLGFARERLKLFSDRATFVHANFGEIPDCLPSDRRDYDMILADLGLSSPHLDSADRGFSFRAESDLDMRFDRTKGMTASMFLASSDRRRLIDVFAQYGEVPHAHRLVDAIIDRRRLEPVRTSTDLVDAAKTVYSYKAIDVVPQIFQALRIAVNHELESLESLLREAPKLLRPGGRLAIMSYHSLEDRLVKQAMRSLTSDEKHPVTGAVSRESPYEALTWKPILPTDEEVKNNPRSRSARLRAIRRKQMYTPVP